MKAFKIIILFVMILSHLISNAQIVIEMKNENGVYTMPCKVNGLSLRFIFDTGASNVSISLAEAVFMLKNGYLDEIDLHGSSYSQIANGEIVENTTINIRELEIGGIKLHNINAIIIHELNAPLLLGQSAISQLGKIQIEGNKLKFMNNEFLENNNSCDEAEKLANQAEEYYFDNLNALSANTFQKAFDLCPDNFDCYRFGLMGDSYFKNENYSSAIKYTEKTLNCVDENNDKYRAYLILGNSYSEIKDDKNAIIFFQKAITTTEDNDNLSLCYIGLGGIYYDLGKHYEAANYFEKGVEFELKHLSTNVNEVMKGKIKDSFLGETYYNIASCYYKLNQETKGDSYSIKSALCGDEVSINFCKRNNLKYELFIVD
jgi:clan AA aspartic protease (TIGR02281 family)